MIDRRGFLTAAAASIFVPQFGRFFREGSGLLVPGAGTIIRADVLEEFTALAKDYFQHVYREAYALETPLRAMFRAQDTGRQFIFGVRTV